MAEESEKPLKLGHLWILSSSGFKKSFKNKFCILTTQRALNWYKKQEDHVDGRKGGSIKKLDTCTIEEAGERTLAGNQVELFCFTITINKTHTLATETERERLNWIVEILKFRGIKGLVDIVNQTDHSLRRHAAYAICNLAGRSRDDSQIRIVQENGVAAMLEFQKEVKEKDLIDSINYALCKLSAREENKEVLVKYLAHLYSLIEQGNEASVDYSLQTIRNCSTNVKAQDEILISDGILKLLDVLCKGEVTKESVLLIATEALLNCTENDEIRLQIVDNMSSLVDAIPKLSPNVQEQVVKILTKCMLREDGSVVEKPVAQTLITLLSVKAQESLLLVATDLLSKLTKSAIHQADTRFDKGLQNLLEIVKLDNDEILQNSVSIIRDCWCDPQNIFSLAKVEDQLISLFALLESKSSKIVEITIGIVDYLSSDGKSISTLAHRISLMNYLLPVLLQLQTATDVTVSHSLSTFVNLSSQDPVKILLCQDTLMKELANKIQSNQQKPLLLSNLIVLRNCAQSAIGKINCRKHNFLQTIESLELKDDEIIETTVQFLEYFTRSRNNRDAVSDAIIDRVLGQLQTSTVTGIQISCCDVVRNISFDNPGRVSAAIARLIEQLSFTDNQVKEKSLYALRNCCSSDGGNKCAFQKAGGLQACVTLVQQENTFEVKENTILLLITVVTGFAEELPMKENLAQLNVVEHLKGFVNPDSKHMNSTLWLLSELCTSDEIRKSLIKHDVLGAIKKCAQVSKDFTVEICYDILDQCYTEVVAFEKKKYLDTPTIEECIRLLTTPSNWRIVSSAISILCQSSVIDANKATLQSRMKDLSRWMNQGSGNIQENLSKLFINVATDEHKNIQISEVKALEALLNDADSEQAGIAKKRASGGVYVRLPAPGQDGSRLEIHSKITKLIEIQFNSEEKMTQQLARSILLMSLMKSPTSLKPVQNTNTNNSNSPILPPDNNNTFSPFRERKKRRSSSKTSTSNLTSSPSSPSGGAGTVNGGKSASGFVFGSKTSRTSARTVRTSSINASNYRTRLSDKDQADGESQLWETSLALSFAQIRALATYQSFLIIYLADILSYILEFLPMEGFKTVGEMETIKPLDVLRDGTSKISLRKMEDKSRLNVIDAHHLVIEYVQVRPSVYPKIEICQVLEPLRFDSSFGYFEVLIICSGISSTIGIGLTHKDHELDQQPGWIEGGWGYHGDDGNKYSFNSEKGTFQNEPFGPAYGTGDIIGCGFDNLAKRIFFTKNGQVIDSHCFPELSLTEKLYPTVGFASNGEKVLINVGQLPFLWGFDFENVHRDAVVAPKAEYANNSAHGSSPREKHVKKDQNPCDIYYDFILNKCGRSCHSLYKSH